MATTKQLEAWVREAWRLHGKEFLGENGELDFEEAEQLDDDTVAAHLLWESVRDFVEGKEPDEAYLMYQRVGSLEEKVAKLQVLTGDMLEVKRQVRDLGLKSRTDHRAIKSIVRDILLEAVGEDF